MTKVMIFALACVVMSSAVIAKDRHWQKGVWRDVQPVTVHNGSVSVPIGNTFFSLPLNDATDVFTIDGPDGLQYVATYHRHLQGIIVNDPMEFAVEGKYVYVRLAGNEKRLTLAKTIRLQE